MTWKSLLATARFLPVLFLCLVTLHLAASPKPLPDAVVRAHSVFLLNETSFNELQYIAIFELNKWGRFDLAESPQKADLILRLDGGNRVRSVPEGQHPGNAFASSSDDSDIPKGHTRICLLDPKTSAVLWSDTHKTEGGKVKNGHLFDGLRDAFDSYEKSRR